jgi:peptidyl-prolyl cis-trans isomerase SurA
MRRSASATRLLATRLFTTTGRGIAGAIGAALLAGIAAVGLALGAATARAADLVDGVAAVVDSDVILLSEVDAQARTMLQRVQQRNPNQKVPDEIVQQVQREALRALIDQKVIKKYATRVELAATQEEIDAAIADIASAEKVTADEIYTAAAREGLSKEQYREELAENITRAKVISGSIRPRVRVSTEEIQKVFEDRYRNVKPGLRAQVRQILIPWPGPQDKATRDQAREFAAKLRQRAVDNGDFAALARQFSAAPSAAQGGVTTLREGEIPPEIARFVFEPPPGSISPVVENQAGLNFFQVVERFDPSQIELKDVEETLRNELFEQRIQPEFEKWIGEQRGQYYIKVTGDDGKK